MNIRVQKQTPDKLACDLLVVPITQGEQKGNLVNALDAVLHGALSEQIERTKFVGKEGETLTASTHGHLPSPTLLLLGLGKAASIDAETWRRVAGKAQREARSQGVKHLAWFCDKSLLTETSGAAIVEGALSSSYTFDKYKSDKNDKPKLTALTLASTDLQSPKAVEKAVEVAQTVTPGLFLARDLTNEPASVSTPRYLGDQATKLLKGHGIKGEVWGTAKIKSAKMAGLLAVAQGSIEEPRFIKLVYTPGGKPKKKVALVGKGITFDSGGLSLKPPGSMETMKRDMAGGATVMGVMSVIAQLKPQVQVTGYVPATENMPSGTAQDQVTSFATVMAKPLRCSTLTLKGVSFSPMR